MMSSSHPVAARTPLTPAGSVPASAPTGRAAASAPAPGSVQADQPAGVEHTYAAQEIFFSTTDRQGRIQRANSTFMRLSGYERGTLVGSPHNVVRHEVMPAGVFRAIWEDIASGAAASTYITNRSSDSGYYRVFATIVPTGTGYLSVRTLPQLVDLRERVEALHSRVRAVEDASRAQGSSAREVAAAGREALMSELAAAGYQDLIDFTRRTLPAEVAALVANGVGIPRIEEADGPVATILEQMRRIEGATSGLVALLEECARLVALLGRRAGDIDDLEGMLSALRGSLRRVVSDAERLGDAGGADHVRQAYEQVDAMVLECAEQLRPLAGQVGELRGDVAAVRFAIALMRLHNLAAGMFAAQIVQGEDVLEANDAVGALGELVAALRSGAQSLTKRLELLQARAELVAGELEEVAGELTGTHAPLLDLLAAAVDAGASDEASVRQVRSSVRDGFPQARDLADLARSVRDLEVPDVASEVEDALVLVAAELENLG